MRRLLAALLALPVALAAAVGDIRLDQQTVASPPTWTSRVVTPTTASLLGFGTASPYSPVDVTLGTGLALASNVLSVSAGAGLPSQTGNSGKFLTTDGSAASWALVPLSTGVSGILPAANGGAGTVSGILKANGSGTVSAAVSGTDYLPITGGTGVVTLGTVTTGTWNASVLAGQYGGTGVANTGKSITLGGNLTTSGAFNTVFAQGASITIALPTVAGTLATLGGTEALTNKTYNGNTWTTGTGTLTLGAGKVFTVSNTLTFTGTDSSSVAFGAGGTVLYSGGAYVSSLTGTANEITASASTGAVTLSLPSALTFTGKTVTGGTFTGGAFNGTVGATTPAAGTFTSVTNSALTAGRVPFAGTGGLMTDDSDMTFATDTLTVTKATIGGISHVANAITSANSIASAASTSLTITTAGINGLVFTHGSDTAATVVADFTALTKTGTSTTAASIIGSSLGLSGKLYVGADIIQTSGFTINAGNYVTTNGAAGGAAGFSNATDLVGFLDTAAHSTNTSSFRSRLLTATSATISTFVAFQADENALGSGSTIATQMGVNVSALSLGSTIYGIRSQVASGATKYNLYIDGTAQNLIAGVTTLSSATASISTSTGALVLSGSGAGIGMLGALNAGTYVAAGSYVLAGTLFGNNGATVSSIGYYGTYASGSANNVQFSDRAAILSTNTGNWTSFEARNSTVAASYTISTLYGYHFFDASKGSGSTVTTQAAIQVDAMTAGATNYAFRSAGAGLVSIGDPTEATTGGAGSLTTAGGIYAAKKLITASTLTTAAGVTYDFGAAAVAVGIVSTHKSAVIIGGATYYMLLTNVP